MLPGFRERLLTPTSQNNGHPRQARNRNCEHVGVEIKALDNLHAYPAQKAIKPRCLTEGSQVEESARQGERRDAMEVVGKFLGEPPVLLKTGDHRLKTRPVQMLDKLHRLALRPAEPRAICKYEDSNFLHILQPNGLRVSISHFRTAMKIPPTLG